MGTRVDFTVPGDATVTTTLRAVGALFVDSIEIDTTSAIANQTFVFDGTKFAPSFAYSPTGEPIGFQNKSDSTISFTNATRTFSISPTSASFVLWQGSQRYVKTTTETVVIPNTDGLHYIYYNTAGTLSTKTTFFTLSTEAPVAYVYWNATDSVQYFFADERHGVTLDWQTHEYLHRTRGAAYASGFDAANYTISGTGSSNADAQIDILNGVFFDEDINISINHAASPVANTWDQRLQGGAYIPAFYKTGTGVWKKDTATQYPLKLGASPRACYNLNTAGTWTTPELGQNKYGISWIVATNNLNDPVVAILGQAEYNNQGDAEAVQWAQLDLGGFPVAEFRPLYKVIYQTSTTYANTPKTRFTGLSDLRSSGGTAGGGVAVIAVDHGALTGLADDDHPQYILADGTRAFTGSITGNVTIAGNLTVNGTTTTINSTVTTIDDVILTLGGDTAPTADDNKDRGIEFRWHNGTTAKVGFFGYDDSTGKFTFIPDATNTSEVFSGTKGVLDAYLDWADVLNKPDPVVTVTLTGAVTGSGNATLTDLANGTISLATTAAASQSFSSLTLSSTTTSLTALGDVVIRGGQTIWDASYASNGSTDLNWKTILTIGTPVGLYVGAEYEVDVVYKSVNYATVSPVNPMKHMMYNVTVIRSAGVQDDSDTGAVWGPVAEYVRLVRVDIATWELQVRQPINYHIVRWRLRKVVNNNTTQTWATSFTTAANGTTGTNVFTANTTYKNEHLFSKVDSKFLFVQPWTTTDVPSIIRAVASQTADLTQWQDSAANVLAKMDAAGNLTIGRTASTVDQTLTVISGDSNRAEVAAYGATQGTGVIYVGQSASYGGGMLYNGDGAPAYATGELADAITFFRRDNGTNTAVFRFSYANSTVAFHGQIQSLLATGTAPLVIASTTLVTNLNADLLDGQHGTYYNDWTNVTNKPSPVITLQGDLVGNVTLTNLTNASLTATIAANSVALGTDTTGNYVATLAAGEANGITVSGSGTENAAVTLFLPQALHASATPTFSSGIFTTTSAAPFSVSSASVVANLNADLLDGQHGSYYLPASSYTAASILAQISTVDGAGSGLDADLLDGQHGAYYLPASTYTAGDILSKLITVDGTTSGLDADLLDGNHAAFFASQDALEAVLGDLMYVGLYDASAYVGTDATKPHPVWSGSPGGASVAANTYRHAMYWIVAKGGTVDFVDTDLSGRYDIGTDAQYAVANGDWIVATNPTHDPLNPLVDLTISQVTFQVLPFSTETFVKAQIVEHSTDAADPHGAAGYLLRQPGLTLSTTAISQTFRSAGSVATISTSTAHGLTVNEPIVVSGVGNSFDGSFKILSVPSTTLITYQSTGGSAASAAASAGATVGKADVRRYADEVFAPKTHNHNTDIAAAITAHVALADPHPIYLTSAEGTALYADINHAHSGLYEPSGTMSTHLATFDHTKFITLAIADQRYLATTATFDSRYYLKGEVDGFINGIQKQVLATDGAQSSRIFIGTTQPSSATAQRGDLWIETDISLTLQAPVAPTNFAATAAGASVTLTWSPWPTSAALTSLTLEWALNSSFTGASALPASPATITTYTHSGLTENTLYYYRLRATNATGTGPNASVSITSANIAPPTPTISASAVGGTANIQATFSAAAYSDAPANKFIMYLNNASVAAVSASPYTFTGLTEGVSYTVGVQTLDTAGLTSPIVNAAPVTTNNLVPPAPASATATVVNNNQVQVTWPAVSITDFQKYRVQLFLSSNLSASVATQDTTNLTHTFTGLNYLTSYTAKVFTMDAVNNISSAAQSASVTTTAQPDTTPPTEATITSFKPETSYGNMVIRGNWPSDADFTSGTVERSTDNTNWTTNQTFTSQTPGASFSSTLGGGPYTAGTTVYVRVKVTDTNNNTRTGATQSYTLITSPSLITADATNSWRNTNGGQYNVNGNYRPYQGYFSNATWNAYGLWYYGTKPNSDLSNSGRRTITGLRFLIIRWDAGASTAMSPVFVLHKETTSPGTVIGVAAPAIFGTEDVSTATVQTVATGNNVAWETLSTQWGIDLVNGTYRGIAVYDATSPVYANFASVADNGLTGTLEFTHLG